MEICERGRAGAHGRRDPSRRVARKWRAMRTCNRHMRARLPRSCSWCPLAVDRRASSRLIRPRPRPIARASSALKAGRPDAALPALEYAADRGVLGAQLKLARIMPRATAAAGRCQGLLLLPADRQSACRHRRPRARSRNMSPKPSLRLASIMSTACLPCRWRRLQAMRRSCSAMRRAISATPRRNIASRRSILTGSGVEKNVGLAVNWLAAAAKKQHAAAQATLGGLLWRGEEVRQRRARGLALIMLAHENAQAGGQRAAMDRRPLSGMLRRVRQCHAQGSRGAASGTWRRENRSRDDPSQGQGG